jgi:hypothetical protein
MFDRSACAKVRLAVEPHTNLSALVMLGALCGTYGTNVLQHRMPPIRAYHLSLAIRIRERPMLRQSRQRSARRRVPQQIDLFAADHRQHAGLVRTTHGDAGGANYPDNEADPRPCRQASDGFDEGRS